MKIATMNIRRYFLTLFVVLFWYSPLSAQQTDEDGQFYLGFAGSAVFPYDPKDQPDARAEGIDFEAGAGFTAAFGYAFKEGFSAEIEWGYQKAGVSGPNADLSPNIDLGGSIGAIGGFEDFHLPLIPFPAITIESDGAMKTQSLMGNVYYRYPKWRVSPYVGFGLGAFFHDGSFTSTFTIENDLLVGIPNIIIPGIENVPPPGSGMFIFPPPGSGIFIGPDSLETTVTYDDSRFAYQIMVGLSARASQLVEFRLGYRFRSSRGEPIDTDQIEAGARFRF